jgi:hypothetical protein
VQEWLAVVGEVSESERVAAQGFQSAVDRLGGSVGGVVVKEGQDVGAASPQGAAELGELLQPCRDAPAECTRSVLSLLSCRDAGWGSA